MNNQTDIFIPILLIGFNRPDCIRKVMQQLEQIKPKVVYFSIDAPRANRPDDVESVNRVRELVKHVNWDCETHYRFFEKNVGAEVNVSSGISWVLENHECLIVNEDDIYAGYSFYRFVQDMLLYYKDDNRIGIVSGLNLHPDHKNEPSYYFLHGGHIWGWGTWKRVWKDFDLNEKIEDKYLSSDFLGPQCVSESHIVNTRRIMHRQQDKGTGNVTWDYMFWYLRLKHNYLGIVPNKNLVTNIGIVGLHSKNLSNAQFLPYDKDFLITEYRKEVTWDKDYAKRIYERNHGFIVKMINIFKKHYRQTFVITDKYIRDFFNS